MNGNRLINSAGRVANISVDGVDCTIDESFPFSKKWWSHKTNGAVLRYEIGVAVKSDNMVWVNGTFLAGAFPDITIFPMGLKLALKKCREMAICHGGYSREPRRIQKKGDKNLGRKSRRFNSLCRARHETVNRRIKKFQSIATT